MTHKKLRYHLMGGGTVDVPCESHTESTAAVNRWIDLKRDAANGRAWGDGREIMLFTSHCVVCLLDVVRIEYLRGSV